jgi:hypothetical protein
LGAALAVRDLGGADGAQKAVERLGEALGLELVEQAVGVAVDGDEIGGLEQGQVAGDGGAGDLEAGGYIAGGEGAVLELFEDLAADGMGKSPEDPGGGLHIYNIAILLNSVKSNGRR